MQAASAEELVPALKADFDSFKGQPTTTNTQFDERLQMRNFLKAAVKSGSLFFPLKLSHGDKPDFTIAFPTTNIGVEATKIASEQLERVQKLHRRDFKDRCIEITTFTVKGPKRDNDELSDISLRGAWNASWQNAADISRFWLESAVSVLERKSRQRERYASNFNETWLLLSDRLSLAEPDFQKHLKLIHPYLKQCFQRNDWYELVAIEYDNVVTILTKNACASVRVSQFE